MPGTGKGDMAEEPVLDASLAALSQFLVGRRTVEETLRRVAELAVEGVEPADLAGLTLQVGGREQTVVYTDEMAPEVDEAQYAADDGPCLDAFRKQEVVVVDTTSGPGPYPAFREAAYERGIRSTLSLPMSIEDRPLGALNLYARRERVFGPHQQAVALLFASHAAVVLANAQAYREADELGRHLSDAMDSRAVIEQAKGILMGAQRCSPDEAFALLVSASQRENVKLREIAQRIVANTMDRSDSPPPRSDDVTRS